MKRREDLLILTHEDFAAASSKLTLKRALKDLDKGMVPKEYDEEEASYFVWEDARCSFPPGGINASSCDCPARKLCLHRVRSILWLQRQEANAPQETEAIPPEDATSSEEPPTPKAEAQSPSEGETQEEWSPAQYTEQELKRAAGPSLWKKAQKLWREGSVPEIRSNTSVHYPTLGISVRFLPHHPIEAAICSCNSPHMCLHRILGVLAFQKEASEDKSAISSGEAALRQRLWEHVVECVIVGLDGFPHESIENFEALAQESAPLLPGASSDLTYLGRLLSDFFRRSSRFSSTQWMRAVGRLGARLRGLAQPLDVQTHQALRGANRRTHIAAKALSLYGLGAEAFESKNGRLIRCWFVHEDTGEVLFCTVGRGAQTQTPLSVLWNELIWGEQSPSLVAHQRVQLRNAKISPDGSISTSESTSAVLRSVSGSSLPHLPAGLIADSEAELLRIWNNQQPVVMRPGFQSMLPAIIAVDKTGWQETQTTFSETTQTLQMPLLLKQGGSITLTANHQPLHPVLLQVLEQHRRWSEPPTHLFVRFWLTSNGWHATPVSAWLQEGDLPVSLGIGQTPAHIARRNLTGPSIPGPHPNPSANDGILSTFQRLLEALEGLAVEGLAQTSKWRRKELRQLLVVFSQMELGVLQTQLSELLGHLEQLSHHPESAREQAAICWLHLLTWGLEWEESWSLKQVVQHTP